MAVKLSTVRDGGVIRLEDRIGIISGRCPADRSSGITTVTWETGGHQTFIWDHEDPAVEFLGPGELFTSIKIKGDSQ